MIIRATAPTRIDLAGGTLDIHPLYVFLDGGLTLNMGITLLSHVSVEPRADARIELRSADTGATLEADDVESLPVGQELDLVARIVKFYAPRSGVNVVTNNSVPHGSGLGASSSLLIALSAALDRLNGTHFTTDQFIDWGANIEAQSIGIPTGKQDYYGAVYGGASAIWFRLDRNERTAVVTDEDLLRQLESSVILTFTGESRFSGTSNWNMLKAYVENIGNNRQSMRAIQRTALAMHEALQAGDFIRFAELVDEEWNNRKQLADGVTTARIDALIAAAAQAGAWSSKICGAGGGGCMITVAPADKHAQVIAALEASGARHLEYRIARRGLTVTQED
jgi:D-glycero-alpha-D-manno-heptose-7-phosphate kinase